MSNTRVAITPKDAAADHHVGDCGYRIIPYYLDEDDIDDGTMRHRNAEDRPPLDRDPRIKK